MLYFPRKVFLVTTSLVILLSLTKNTEAGFPILDEMMTLWGYIEKFQELGEDPQKEIMSQFTKVSGKIEEVKQQIIGVSDSIQSLGSLVRISGVLQPQLNDIYTRIRKINVWYKEVQRFLKDYAGTLKNDAERLEAFAEDLALGSETTKICMEHLLSMVIEPRDNGENVIQTLGAYNEADVCYKNVTTPQLLYKFYTTLLRTEVKSFFITNFSFLALKQIRNSNIDPGMREAKEDFLKNIEDLTKSFKIGLQRADQTIYKCDPKVHAEGQTFDRITRLIQGYITNEYFLSHGTDCRSQCAHYKNTIQNVPCQRPGEHSDKYCSSGCEKGTTFRCREASGWLKVEACHNFDPYKNTKRFFWATDNNGEYGKKTDENCEYKYQFSYFNERIQGDLSQCDPCYCLCDREFLSDRFFSLDEVKCDVQDNKVVTGIRLRKYNRIFNLEIQQGELLPYGNINTTTLEWLKRRNAKQSIFKMGHHRRSIALDEQRSSDSNYVLTGVKFAFQSSSRFLEYEIHLTKFNFSTGKLDKTDSKWKSGSGAEIKRTEVVLHEPDESDLNNESKSTWKPNQYIKFDHTDWKKDFAQSTVPYIDIQSVVNNPPAPLSGFGLYHKGKDGYGGFIAPKLLSYEYDRYLEGI